MRGGVIFLLLAGVVFCCLGTLLPLPPASSPRSEVAEVPSGLVGTNDGAGHLYGGAPEASAPVPDVSNFLLPPAEEVREKEKLPVNALVLTGLALAMASFVAGALWLLATNARGWAASRPWGVEDDTRLGLAATRLGACFLGVFLL